MGKITKEQKIYITENVNDTKERSSKDELFSAMTIYNVCGGYPILNKETDYSKVVDKIKDEYSARYFKEPTDLLCYLDSRKTKILLDGTIKPTGELEYFMYDAKNKLYYVNHEKVIKVFAKLLNEIELTYSDLFQYEKEIIKDYFFYRCSAWYDNYLLITPERYLIRLAKFGKDINYEDAEFKKHWKYEKCLYAPKYAQKNKFRVMWKEKFLVRGFLNEYFDFDFPKMYNYCVHTPILGTGMYTSKCMDEFENINFERCVLNENQDW